MDYGCLVELRKEFRAVTFEQFVRFFMSIDCDLSYSHVQWIHFQDAPLIWVTGHSYGKEFIEWINPKPKINYEWKIRVGGGEVLGVGKRKDV